MQCCCKSPGSPAQGGEHKRGSGARADGSTQERRARARPTGGKRTLGSTGGRPFISYVAMHLEDEEPDPDGLDQPARMALEDMNAWGIK